MSQEQNTTETRKCVHLTFAERKTIERILRESANKEQIARALLRDKSVIKREIKRGSVVQRKRNPYESKEPGSPEFIEYTAYFADAGQRIYENNRLRCGAKSKIVQCADMVEYVESKILGNEKWSPDAALGYAKANGMFLGQEVTTKTFYNWIDSGLVKVKNIDLLLKVRRKPKTPRQKRKIALGRSIDERPTEANSREVFGHWEGDGIVGKNGRGFLISLVERKLGIGLLFNAGSKEKDRIVSCINALEKRYGDHFGYIFKSITFDNGMEFSDSAGMEKAGRTMVYYAHPYSSFERGTNENWNGIVRRFLPKGKSFDDLTERDINRVMHYINTLPRKRFDYKTPLDLWHRELERIMES